MQNDNQTDKSALDLDLHEGSFLGFGFLINCTTIKLKDSNEFQIQRQINEFDKG